MSNPETGICEGCGRPLAAPAPRASDVQPTAGNGAPSPAENA